MDHREQLVPLPHVYPFRFVDTVSTFPAVGADRPEGVPWRGEARARVSANAWAGRGGEWGSRLLLAEAIAQAALLLQGGDPETGRRGFLAGIDGFEAARAPRPGETLAITVEMTARFGAIVKFHGEVRADDGTIARGAVLVRKGESEDSGGGT